MNFKKYVTKQESRYKRGNKKNVVIMENGELKIYCIPQKSKMTGMIARVHPIFSPGTEKYLQMVDDKRLECDWKRFADEWVKQREAWNEVSVIDRFKNSVLGA
jgi:hypothetical protein